MGRSVDAKADKLAEADVVGRNGYPDPGAVPDGDRPDWDDPSLTGPGADADRTLIGPWPADRIERRPIGQLIPYARNARTHDQAQVDKIIRSMREFGWTNPVLIDEEGTIIAGHGRVMAAQAMGIAEVPVMIAAGWSDEQKRAYVIADNKLALDAGWDEDILRDEIGSLGDLHFDLTLTGFDLAEIGNLFEPEPIKDSRPQGDADTEEREQSLWAIIIECDDEDAQKKTLERLLADGFKCRAVT